MPDAAPAHGNAHPQPPPPAPPQPPENVWLNLLFNVGAPLVVLNSLSKPERIGPTLALVVAVALPLGYGLYDLARRRRWNLLSGIGLTGVLLTGGLGLLRLDPFWFAVKEAAIPLVLALVVGGSLALRRPLVRALLYSPQLLDIPAIEQALAARGTTAARDRLFVEATGWVAASFTLSAVLNFILARIIITAAPATEEFNRQLARLNWVSLLVITVPAMVLFYIAFWRLLTGLRTATGLGTEALLRPPPTRS